MVIYLLFCPKCKRKHLDLIRLWFSIAEVYCPLLQLFFGPCTSRKAAVWIGLEQWTVVWSQLQLEKPTRWSQPSGWVLWKLGDGQEYNL